MDQVHVVLSRFLEFLVVFYQASFSRWLGGNCRFHPSCSEYALEALRNKDPIPALKLIFSRLSKCHPFGPSGYDPLPLKESE